MQHNVNILGWFVCLLAASILLIGTPILALEPTWDLVATISMMVGLLGTILPNLADTVHCTTKWQHNIQYHLAKYNTLYNKIGMIGFVVTMLIVALFTQRWLDFFLSGGLLSMAYYNNRE